MKFCGMKNEDTLAYGVELGVDYLGFIIEFPKSPRSISVKEFYKKAEWLRRSSNGNFKVVAVTVDMPVNRLELLIKDGVADIIQLHGTEPARICGKIKAQKETWKAFPQHKINKKEILNIAATVDKVLVDSGTASEKASGKSGTFNAPELYNMLVKEEIPVILSGGINAGNVQNFISGYHPSVIDVSSGIESSPGLKSRKKMKEFMDAMKQLTEQD